MVLKRASEIFRQVDPHLTVIDGGVRRRRSRSGDWDKAGGAACPKCGQEAVRFRVQDGVCTSCARGLDEKWERDEKKRKKQFQYVKAHNARIKKGSH